MTTVLVRFRRAFAGAVLGIGFYALTGAPASAQASSPATATITGRVYNPATQEYVHNAEVRLEGSNAVTYTEQDGSFELRNVAAGDATVVVNYTGYNPARYSLNVAAGATATPEINLTTASAAAPAKDAVVKLEAFTISSEREGNSKAIMDQRRNMNITTSVSSDIFGDVTDGNVGEFLKYMPGVDLDYVEAEARGPRLGGMDAQYVGVSFDGMRTASADANRGNGAASRATSFEGFSITSIDSIEINRTASPENDADSPAGVVNMKSKRAFDRKGRRIDYNFGMNFNSDEFTLHKTWGPGDGKHSKVRPNYQFSYAESFLDQRFGILLSASRANSYTNQKLMTNGYNRNPIATDSRPLVVRQIQYKDGPKLIQKDSLLLTTDWKATPHLTLSLNLIYSYFDGQFHNRQFDFVAANDNANVNNGRSMVGGDAMTTVIATRAASGSVNNVATLNNSGGSSTKLVYTRQYIPKFEYKAGAWTVDGALSYARSVNNYESLERGFSNSEGGGVASSWIATRPSPKSWEWTIRQTSGNDWFDLRSFTSTNTRAGGTKVENDDRTWVTEKWTGNLNARWVLPILERFPTALKFGAKWDEETRNTGDMGDMAIWSYNGPGGNTTTVSATNGANIISTFGSWANLGPQYVSGYVFNMGQTNALNLININGVQGMAPRPSRNAISDLFHAHPEMFVSTATPENYYADYFANPRHFRQTINAGYSQADVRLTAKLSLRFGARVESTENKFKVFSPLTRAEVLAAGYTVNAVGSNGGRALTLPGMIYQYTSQPQVTNTSRYHNYFPSALVKYTILRNLEFQAGFNRGIGRPAVDNLTGLWVIDEQNNRVTAPNPDLLPEQHKNYQARLAYYFGTRWPGQFSLGYAQNDATNFITTTDYSASEFGVDDPAYASYTFRTSQNNNSVQRTRSLEVSYSQTLGFLPSEYLRGVSVGTTYARAYANIRRPGLAPHRLTGRLGYAYRRFNGQFGVIWVDDKPESSTYGRYFGAITKFDLTLNWRLTGRATIYAQGRNITNVKDEWYQSPADGQEGKHGALRAMEEYGANWVFGLKGTF
jgi:iron complex outermembrane recepter protein